NPLFVEQITLELAERGALRTNDPLAIALPLTVEAALQSRLDLLPDRERELVKRLSVYGRPVTIDDLVAVGVAEPAPGLGSLVAQRVLRAGGPGHGAGATYHVLSPLVAEAAYRMNAPELLVALHHAAADRLAGHGADPEEIAVHRERAGQAQEASRAYVQAALAASARGDSLRALRCSDRALALGDPGELAFALRMARADALRFLGRATDQERELAAASAVARDDVMRARVLTEEVVRLARAGRRDDARRVADGAVEAARRSGDRAVLALALARRAEMLIFAGGPGEAEEALAEAEQLAPHAGLETRALVCAFRARLANVRGDLGGARASFERAVALYRELGDVRRGASAEANLADAYNRVGAYDAASVALAHALDGCRRIGNRLMEGYALANLAHARTMQGRPDEALRRLEEADAVLALAHDARLALAVTVYRARAWLALGRSEEAATAADSAASDAIRLKLPSLAALALTVGARAFVRSGDTRRALDRSGRALALRDTLGGAEDDEGEVYLAHVDALCAAGQHKLAAEVRERAKARLEEIAGRIADPDWRLRFLRDVPAHRALMDEASRA
ncbi:MAG: tetratricopeptide repeat protein, partial [Deltaproteobacteria bacterium]|nr:tetratricopeptide repeat protein [Deltaproteobacteria bacterium]